ncbi:MAG: hypothetical protein ACT4PZ_05295 [Panacagrimonas sp.]
MNRSADPAPGSRPVLMFSLPHPVVMAGEVQTEVIWIMAAAQATG